MHEHTVGVVGASGYAGIEATRLLAYHPQANLRFVTSDRWGGERVAKRTGLGGAAGDLVYASQEKVEDVAAGCAVVFLATPAEVSLALVPKLLAGGSRIVDLSGAFRLRDAAAYPKHYGFTHAAPALLELAVYGLPELSRKGVPTAKLVANPGCYPTAAALSLAPLLAAGLVDPASIVIDAASGVTGAGRKANEDFSFTEIEGDFRAYRVGRHQHSPEITQTLSLRAGAPVSLTFTPHLLPVKRGILSTAHARLLKGADAAAVAAAFDAAYGREPFVTLAASADEVSLKSVVGTNRCQIGFAIDAELPDRLSVVSSIDNLVKGAAGQAVQNLNLMMGWEETSGLLAARAFHP